MKSPLSPWLQHKRLVHREYNRRWYQQNRIAAGLTYRGTVRKYVLHAEISHLHGNDRKIAREKLYRQRFMDLGLRYDGKPRKRGMNRVETAWRQLRASMVLPAPGWWDAA